MSDLSEVKTKDLLNELMSRQTMSTWAREIVENLESHISKIEVDTQIAKVALMEDLEQLKHFLYS